MKVTTLFVTAIILILAVGCSSMGKGGTPDILGIWQGESQGADLTLEFRKDMTFTAVIAGNQDFTVNGKYTVDYTSKPIAVDLTDFDVTEIPGGYFIAILEFTKTGGILWQGNMGYDGNEVERPTEFNNTVVELTRKK
ncbi:hypothetical protein ACFL47_05215 [Candidatus Latescibacterota bacterium]